MEATAQSVIKEVATRLHSEILKPRGFKKTAYTWIRDDDWPKVINLQLSRWNTSEKATFTLNLGIYIQELHDAAGSYPVTGKPKEPNCDIRNRIGALLPAGNDKWWDVTASSNVALLYEEVSADIIDTGLPWLESLHDYPSVAAELISQKNLFMAAIAFKIDGRDNEAAKAMETAHAKANKHFLPKLKRIAKAQHIPIKG